MRRGGGWRFQGIGRVREAKALRKPRVVASKVSDRAARYRTSVEDGLFIQLAGEEGPREQQAVVCSLSSISA
jgi:hypothetical protein